MNWVCLGIAGILEIVWSYAMKRSDGFTHAGYAGVAISAVIASLALLSISMRSLPLGTAYAAWTGIGVAGSFLLGAVFLREEASPLRVVSVCLICLGIIGLRLASPVRA